MYTGGGMISKVGEGQDSVLSLNFVQNFYPCLLVSGRQDSDSEGAVMNNRKYRNKGEEE